MVYLIKQSSKEWVSLVTEQRGMLTVEAAVLIPAVLMLSVVIIMVMFFEFQSILMTAGMHQYGITALHEVTTERLDMKNSLEVAGDIVLTESLELADLAGIRTLKLDVVLEPDRRWIKRLKPVRGRSFHLRLPVSLLVFGIYQQQPEVVPDDE